MNSLEQEFKEEAEHLGYVVFRRGWPDFLIVRGKTVQGVEVKGPNDYVTNEQSAMMNALANAGIDCWVWRNEWRDPDIIKQELQEESIIAQIIRNYEWKLGRVRSEIERTKKDMLEFFRRRWRSRAQFEGTYSHITRLFDSMIEMIEEPPSKGTLRLVRKWERVMCAES